MPGRRRLHKRKSIVRGLMSPIVLVAVVASLAAVEGRATFDHSAYGARTRGSASVSRTVSTRPAGLVQGGDSKTACIYSPLGTSLVQVEHATGVQFNCLETFSDADPTWADWVTPWVTKVGYGYRGWLAANPIGRTIILTQNLIPDSEASDPNWRAEGAAGKFDKYAHLLAEHLVNSGFGDSVIRLGHEMNGTWYNDSIGDTRTEWQQWARYFAQIVATMRSVKGAHFLFDWNVNAGLRDIPLADFYPGNSAVDIVGIDFYDVSPRSNAPPASSATQRWNFLSSEPLGLDAVAAFARRHSKPLSLPEWGTVDPDGSTSGFQATGGGDDGAYVTHIGHFIASHDVAYQAWYDVGDNNVNQLDPSAAPNSVAAYVRTLAHLRSSIHQ